MATWQNNPGLLQSGQPLFGSGTSGLLGYTPKSIPHYIGPKALPDFSKVADSISTPTSTSTTSPLAMPDVEGYKYAYVPWQWNQDGNRYDQLSFNVWDQTQYPYFPYMPTGGQVIRDGNRQDRILVGFRLVPDGTEGDTTISTTTTTTTPNTKTTPNDYTTTTTAPAQNPYATYVDENPDLSAAYNQYLSEQDSRIVDSWEIHGMQHGVGGMQNYPGVPMAKEQFGHAHWAEYGQYEDRDRYPGK